jgi:hypothetical protein
MTSMLQSELYSVLFEKEGGRLARKKETSEKDKKIIVASLNKYKCYVKRKEPPLIAAYSI